MFLILFVVAVIVAVWQTARAAHLASAVALAAKLGKEIEVDALSAAKDFAAKEAELQAAKRELAELRASSAELVDATRDVVDTLKRELAASRTELAATRRELEDLGGFDA